AQPRLLHDVHDVRRRHAERLLERAITAALLPSVEGARRGVAEVLREHRRLLRVRTMRIAHYLYWLKSCGTLSGCTDSMKSSSTITGVAKPHAPRHSTSITVKRPSGDVAPSSPHLVCCRSASTTFSAPHAPHGDVVHTWMKCFPTGCGWYMV